MRFPARQAGTLSQKEVAITKGIDGGTANIHPTLLKGDFDLYPEYTGTTWAFVVKREDIPDDDTLYAELQKAYNKLGLKWTELYSFNNTFAPAVRRDVAEQYGIETYSDIAEASPTSSSERTPTSTRRRTAFRSLPNPAA